MEGQFPQPADFLGMAHEEAGHASAVAQARSLVV
jgi:hypothetical protein